MFLEGETQAQVRPSDSGQNGLVGTQTLKCRAWGQGQPHATPALG